MKMSKVGNQTNSQDPQAVNSRVFVGNLNTFQCSKTDVERMFQRYGRLAGISMHKGYAFVQFTNPFDARSACLGEDGRTVLSQILDVNMVAEPKPHQTGRKRQNVSKTGNDCTARINLPVRGVSFKGPLYPSLKVPTNPKLDV
ncbi:Heterogeneous nuclear ribonucleoprotein C [Atta colombica]|uniref:Heterogeneous nuclear ribonucleoprotein C n=1 Tax=Atta colombica TaxID=520822 RepID=A0A195AVF2_9HYME|nr:Heterogeneous nuclear ribonucleoprotein C [Atta colombica]